MTWAKFKVQSSISRKTVYENFWIFLPLQKETIPNVYHNIICFCICSWILDEDTGNLIAYQLRRQDEGMYRCIAENAAGRIQAESYLDVVIRPKVQELFNKTFPINHPEGRIVCKASGDPLPDIIWRKWSRK